MYETIRVNESKTPYLQYFVPFRFDESRFGSINQEFRSATREGARQTLNVWEEKPFPCTTDGIYDHVLTTMNIWENKNSICRSWKYAKPNKIEFVYTDTEYGDVRFNVTDIYIHLFRTGVGFLSYEISIGKKIKPDPGFFIRFQARAKELARKDADLFRISKSVPETREGSRITEEKIPVIAGETIAVFLRETSGKIAFFHTKDQDDYPHKAILFSYLVYQDPKPENESAQPKESISVPDNPAVRKDLQGITMHMAMGYDQKHILSEADIDSCPELAGNVFYYASQNGCAISAFPNELNRPFFVDNTPTAKYSFIFFFVLYQHYSLRNYTMRVSNDFPSNSRVYRKKTRHADKMQDYTTNIDTFLMKSDLATISTVQYNNLYYEKCREALNIEKDIRSLRSGFESLGNIQQSMRTSQQRMHDRLLNFFVSGIGLITFAAEYDKISPGVRIAVFVLAASAAAWYIYHWIRER